MLIAKSPYILTKLFKNSIYWDIKTNKKILYLSFDDGPIPEVTPKVLALLKKYNALASFFMVAENVEKHRETFNEVVAAGHTIGNHTYNHMKAWSNSDFTYFRNIIKASEFISTKLFRPPHGQLKPSQLRSLSKRYNIVMWSVLSVDYSKNVSPERCAKNVIKNAKNGSIIVFHDSLKAQDNMLYALEETLKHFKGLGYNFESLKHLA